MTRFMPMGANGVAVFLDNGLCVGIAHGQVSSRAALKQLGLKEVAGEVRTRGRARRLIPVVIPAWARALEYDDDGELLPLAPVGWCPVLTASRAAMDRALGREPR